MWILLVEDEEYMAQAVAQVLEKSNYTVDLAHDGEYNLDAAVWKSSKHFVRKALQSPFCCLPLKVKQKTRWLGWTWGRMIT